MNDEEITLCDVLYSVEKLRTDVNNVFEAMKVKDLADYIVSLENENQRKDVQIKYLEGMLKEYKERLEEYEPKHINVIGECYDVNDCND